MGLNLVKSDLIVGWGLEVIERVHTLMKNQAWQLPKHERLRPSPTMHDNVVCFERKEYERGVD